MRRGTLSVFAREPLDPNSPLQPLPSPPPSAPDWSWRWHQLARSVGLCDGEPLLVALSGGADSVLLLHLAATARPRSPVRAVHVDHNLRGEESRADAHFCENLCRSLGVPLSTIVLELDPQAPSLEARAREARYRALIDEALRTGHHAILTGHHSDDQVETLLLRWIRGTHMPGLAGLRARVELDPYRAFGGSELATPDAAQRIALVRPLIGMRRAEVRRLLSDRGIVWRDDSHNVDPRFSRAKVRHGLMPTLRRLGGDQAVENLRAFGRAVEALEVELAGRTAHVAWNPAPWAPASRGGDDARLGGVVERPLFMRLAPTLRRRVLWRLFVEGTGRAPTKALLQAVMSDLAAARCTRHSLPGGWTLVLRTREIALIPPFDAADPVRPGGVDGRAARPEQRLLPFPETGRRDVAAFPPAAELAVPGLVTLADARRVSAEIASEPSPIGPNGPVGPGRSTGGSRRPVAGGPSPWRIEVDADRLPATLTVRTPRRGDRFHPLGAPGSRPLRRFLADRGVPREERDRMLLVEAAGEIVWVCGLGPSDRVKITPTTRARVRLALHHPVLSRG